MLKKILLSPWTAVLTLVLVLGVRIADPSFVESVRLRYFDTLITSQPAKPVNIVTANIDESALDKYGQWPFRRDVYSEIILDLYKRGAGLVVFNIMMPEKDRLGGDAVLSQVMKSYPVIVPNRPDQTSKNIPRVPGSVVLGPEYLNQLVQYPGIIANIPEIESAAIGSGTTHTKEEIDGVNRRMPLIIAVGDKLYPGLAIETLRVLAQDSTFQVKLNEFGVEKLRVPSFGPITTDSLGRVWVDWSQQSQSYSITKLPTDLKGATVIVGVTAAGLGNPVPTAKGAVWPHEVQAATLATMVTGTNIQRPDWADGAEILGLVLLAIISILLTRWTYGFIAVIAILGGVYFGSRYLFQEYSFLLDASFPIVGLVLVYVHSYTVKFLSELSQKLQIKKQFGSYVNPTIVERLQKNPELIKLGGERRELSIVMTDLRGFTTLGESFGDDVEGLTQIMNDYMTALSIPVLKNDGTLIKFIGDASLHVHGAPLDDVNHAKTAVQTALEMIQAIEEFNKELVAGGRPPVGMGAGVNTGETLIGNIGAKSKFGYDVLGDSVSTAARLEGQTKSYGVLLIIGPKTAEYVKDDFSVVWLDNIAVKGKTVGLDIYTIGDTVKYKHDEFRKEYTRGDWKKAIKWAKELEADPKVTIKEYYHKMIARMEDGLPANWDGTYHATSK